MKFRVSIACLLFGVVPAGWAESVGCGSARVSGGPDCPHLKVMLDLQACGETAAAKKAWLSCGQNTAVAGARIGDRFYRVRLAKRTAANEQAAIWELESPVAKTEAVGPAERRPAGQMPMAKTEFPAAPLAEPSPAPFSGFSVSGVFDGYYNYNFNRPRSVPPLSDVSAGTSAMQPGNNKFHFYDGYSNQMSLALAEVSLKRTGKEVGLLVDFDFGQVADLNALAFPANQDGYYTSDDVTKNVGQGFLTYAPKDWPRLKLEFGKMYSPVGLETPKAHDNWNYSRSLLFAYGIPCWHMGLHLGYDMLPDIFGTHFYVFNGWNTMNSSNSGKTLGAQLRYTPISATSVVYNFMSGPQQPGSGALRTLHEVNASYNWTPRLAMAMDLLSATEENAATAIRVGRVSWRAATFAVKFQATSRFYMSPRLEIFDDANGYILDQTGVAQRIQSYTLTGGFEIGDGLETRLEVRTDVSNASPDSFATGHGLSTSQTVGTLAVLYTL